MTLANHCSYAMWFVNHLVKYPEDMFSHAEANRLIQLFFSRVNLAFVYIDCLLIISLNVQKTGFLKARLVCTCRLSRVVSVRIRSRGYTIFHAQLCRA